MKRSRRSILRKARQSGYERRPITVNGKELLVQGFEGQVLTSLASSIKRIEVDMDKMPEIRYQGRRWKRRYYPDALIETTSGKYILLEVKSLFTLKKGGVLSKAKAAWEFCSQYENLTYLIALYKPKIGITWISSLVQLQHHRKKSL